MNQVQKQGWNCIPSCLLTYIAEYMNICESILSIPRVCIQWKNGLQKCCRHKIVYSGPNICTINVAKLNGTIDSVQPMSVDSIVINGLTPCALSGFKRTAQFRNLRHLNLHMTTYEISPNLCCCHIIYGSKSSEGLASTLFTAICSLQNLRTLNLSGLVCMNSEGIEMIVTNLVNLESLNVLSTKITDDDVRHLSTMKKLVDLSILITHLTLECIQYIACMQLRRLYLSGNRGDNWLNDACCVGLAKVTSLCDLSIAALNEITDVGIKHLSSLVNLKQFTLNYGKFTDVGATHIAQLPHLTDLDVSDCRKLSRNYLQPFVKEKTKLRKLVSNSVSINAHLLEHFSTTLEELELNSTKFNC